MMQYQIVTSNNNVINFATDLKLGEAVRLIKTNVLPRAPDRSADFIMRTMNTLERTVNTKDPKIQESFRVSQKNAAMWMLHMAQQYIDSLKFRISLGNIQNFFNEDNAITEFESGDVVIRLSKDENRVWVNRLTPSDTPDKLYDSLPIGIIQGGELEPFMARITTHEVEDLKRFNEAPHYNIVDKSVWTTDDFYDCIMMEDEEETKRQSFHADDEEVKRDRQRTKESELAAVSADEFKKSLSR